MHVLQWINNTVWLEIVGYANYVYKTIVRDGSYTAWLAAFSLNVA